MQWFKSSALIIFLLFPVVSFGARFSSVECLNAKYNTSIEHSGKFFGLLKNKLEIKKEGCLVNILFKGIFETIWKVDICREPIHMKVTSKGSEDVYKRDKECDSKDKSDYCYFRNELMENIQDYGLIFADGKREVLTDAHGQTYCSYLLLQRYLDDGYVFSTFENPKNIYEKQESCELPQKEKNSEIKKIMTTETPKTESEVVKEVMKAPKGALEEDKKEESSDKPRF